MKDKEYTKDILEDLCRIRRATMYNHAEGQISNTTLTCICMAVNNAINFIKEYCYEKD